MSDLDFISRALITLQHNLFDDLNKNKIIREIHGNYR